MNEHRYLRLVRFDAEAEEIHELLSMPEVYEYLADGIEPPRSIAEDWVGRSEADFASFGGGLWALEASRNDAVLGLVRLSGFDDKGSQLTYLLHPSVWGHGYASQMAHTAMHRVFALGAATSVWAGADVANDRSVAVLKRLGMTYRRRVEYPAGPGVEYALDAIDFDTRRFELLPMWTWEEEQAFNDYDARFGLN